MFKRTGLRAEMQRHPDISLVIPMHNEEGNVGPLLSSLMTILRGLTNNFEVIVVDDNSTDNTGRIADSFSESHPEVTVIHRSDGKRGVGFNYRAGFKRARGDIILTMDGDMSHDPRDLPKMLEAMRGVGVVVGSRYVKGATADMPTTRAFLSRLFNIFVSILFLVGVKDITSGYRAMRRESIAAVKLESNSFDVYPELLLKIARLGDRIVEIPIHYSRRRFGESKLSYMRMLPLYLRSLIKLRFRTIGSGAHLSARL